MRHNTYVQIICNCGPQKSEFIFHSRMYVHTYLSRSTIEERRRREIEESKFLGGDLKHTHLVKGLDYVLKQKVWCVCVCTHKLLNRQFCTIFKRMGMNMCNSCTYVLHLLHCRNWRACMLNKRKMR